MERKSNYLSFRSCSGAVDVDRCERDQCLDAQLHRLFICLVEHIHHFLGIKKDRLAGMETTASQKYNAIIIPRSEEDVNDRACDY